MDRPIYDAYHKLVSEENISSKYRSRDVVPTAMPRIDAIHSRFRWRDDGSQIMMMVVVMMMMIMITRMIMIIMTMMMMIMMIMMIMCNNIDHT